MYLFFKSIAAILVSGVMDLHFLMHESKYFQIGGRGFSGVIFIAKGGGSASSKLNF